MSPTGMKGTMPKSMQRGEGRVIRSIGNASVVFYHKIKSLLIHCYIMIFSSQTLSESDIHIEAGGNWPRLGKDRLRGEGTRSCQR